MSLWEMMMVVIIVLIVFGPDKVPKVARTMGRVFREMRKAAAEVQRTIELEDLRQELRMTNQSRRPKAKVEPIVEEPEGDGDEGLQSALAVYAASSASERRHHSLALARMSSHGHRVSLSDGRALSTRVRKLRLPNALERER